MNNIIEAFRATVRKYPTRVAVVDKNGKLTFSELYDKSIRLAFHIISKTSGLKNKPIAVMLPKSKDCLVAFLAVAMSGNYYSPIDIRMPEKRRCAILENLKPVVFIGEENYSGGEVDIIYGESICEEYNEDIVKTQVSRLLSVDPLYVLFTSGSTGVPKGVVVSHASVIDYVHWLEDTFKFDENTIIANQAPFYFDNSVLDIYSMIILGTRLVITEDKIFSFPRDLISYLSENNVNTLFWVPSALRGLANCDAFANINQNLDLKMILFCGEVMPTKYLTLWQKKFPYALCANLYGPTEITDVCAFYVVDREFADNEIIPIGKPCNNMEIIILDENNNMAVQNKSGEIYVRGIGVAKGYYRAPEKNKTAFIQNPLHNDYMDIVYKTGDLGYWDENDNIIYVGRVDNQIKHQGYRIELGEIEAAAISLNGVNIACAVYTKSKQIELYVEVVTKDIDAKMIFRKLKEYLPKYMVPKNIVIYDGPLPLNANGKVDRVLLRRISDEKADRGVNC